MFVCSICSLLSQACIWMHNMFYVSNISYRHLFNAFFYKIQTASSKYAYKSYLWHKRVRHTCLFLLQCNVYKLDILLCTSMYLAYVLIRLWVRISRVTTTISHASSRQDVCQVGVVPYNKHIPYLWGCVSLARTDGLRRIPSGPTGIDRLDASFLESL